MGFSSLKLFLINYPKALESKPLEEFAVTVPLLMKWAPDCGPPTLWGSFWNKHTAWTFSLIHLFDSPPGWFLNSFFFFLAFFLLAPHPNWFLWAWSECESLNDFLVWLLFEPRPAASLGLISLDFTRLSSWRCQPLFFPQRDTRTSWS